MDVQDVLGNVADFLLPEQGPEGLGSGAGQDVQGAPEGQTGVAVILGALVAAAVGAVVLQKAVQAVGGLADGGPALLLADVGQQEEAEQHILGAPAGPVAHGLIAVAHPPEVILQVRGQNPVPDLLFDAGGEAGIGFFQLRPQQKVDGGQQGPGLRRKQVDEGPGGVGQGQLGGVPDVGVVGRQLPGALLADGPDGVGDGVQVAAPVLHTLGADQGAQPGPAGEGGLLPVGPPSAADKVQPEGQGHGGNGPGRLGLAGVQKALAGGVGEGFPVRPLTGRRAGPEGGQHRRQKG